MDRGLIYELGGNIELIYCKVDNWEFSTTGSLVGSGYVRTMGISLLLGNEIWFVHGGGKYCEVEGWKAGIHTASQLTGCLHSSSML